MKFVFLLLALIFPFTVSAAEPLKVKYAIYASGFEVVHINGTYIRTDDGKFDMTMDLVTAGMLGKLAPWAGVLKSDGLDKGENSTPLRHSFANTWRGETETSRFAFDKNGKLQSYQKTQEDGTVEDKMPEPDIYAGGALDMMTALYRTMNKTSCEGTELAMDGKRKFDMVFRSRGMVQITPNKYTNYNGMAEACEVEIVPITGKWRDNKRGWMSIQEQARSNGQMPRIWFGKVNDNYPAIPVRFQIKTDYGVMMMHLVSAK